MISVLESALERSGTGWLLGDKCTFADLSFVTWNLVGEGLLKELGQESKLIEFPGYVAWMTSMSGREEVRKIKDRMAKGRAEHGLK